MTDHASEARWLVDGKNQPASTHDLHNPEADRMIATAQVHATLALVEEVSTLRQSFGICDHGYTICPFCIRNSLEGLR